MFCDNCIWECDEYCDLHNKKLNKNDNEKCEDFEIQKDDNQALIENFGCGNIDKITDMFLRGVDFSQAEKYRELITAERCDSNEQEE
jgi:hypothetical protein